ncbi:MAG TPA: hypothetical protein DCY88_09425 [Cyanobacteria bacterium UBA11372]|nr:hypothetical protein [Cyanobacteria bacterium UBA11372]
MGWVWFNLLPRQKLVRQAPHAGGFLLAKDVMARTKDNRRFTPAELLLLNRVSVRAAARMRKSDSRVAN